MKLTIDRIEGEVVICENSQKEMLELPLHIFPVGVKEGDVVNYIEGTIMADHESTSLQKKKMAEKMNRLFHK